MRPCPAILPLLFALLARAAHAQLTVGALADGRGVFWFNGPDTPVCYIVPPGSNAGPKSLVLTTLGGAEQHRLPLPADASGCLPLNIARAPSAIRLEEHRLAVVGPTNATLVATAPFNVSSVRLTASASLLNATAVSFAAIAVPVNLRARRAGDAVRLVGRDEVVAGECPLYPGGAMSPTQASAKCEFRVVRSTAVGLPARGPFTVRFYSEGAASPAAVLVPTPTQQQQWATWGI